MKFDVAVIGGGPGGYVAAIRAAQLGAKPVIIEKENIGGTCLHKGCIPTKTILASVAKYKDLKSCQEFGLHAENISFDFSSIMDRKKAVVQQLFDGLIKLIKSHGIEVIKGEAKLQKDRSISVKAPLKQLTIHADKIILATGSRPFMPPIVGIDLDGILDSDALLEIDKIPESMVIVGGGVIGLEFASIFQNLGCQVTVVELLPTIIDKMDKDIITRLGLPLRKQGIKFMTSCKVKRFFKQNGLITTVIESSRGEEEVLSENVLVCTGRVPNVENIGLKESGIDFTNKGVVVNNRLETSVEGIYAIGDMTGQLMLAHAASSAGIVAAENACGRYSIMKFDNIPSCIFTIPEVASVGLTEQEAIEKNMDVVISKNNFMSNGKALASGETDGFVKIIADKHNGVFLGMHIVGPHASDLIMEGTVAIYNKLTAAQVSHAIHPHPTLSETIMECAHATFGHPIHQLKMKKTGK